MRGFFFGLGRSFPVLKATEHPNNFGPKALSSRLATDICSGFAANQGGGRAGFRPVLIDMV